MYRKGARCPRILVVDDEPETCRVLAEALSSAEVETVVAGTAAQAMDAAARRRPDMVVADIRLPDASGLELVRRLRGKLGELPAVIVTGCADPSVLTEASRLRPVELLTKPVDLSRLRTTVLAELARQENYRRVQRRTRRLRDLARRINRQRKHAYKALCATCADLAGSCRNLQTRLERQQMLAQYQTELLGCANEDDIFSRLFRLFVERTGPVFGAALLCDENAELQLVGRFGVPVPDGVNFCNGVATAVLPPILERPEVTALDAMENIEMFPEPLRRLLVGVTLLVVPLMVGEGRMIGMVVLYRKGEQPFTDDDVAVAELIASPTAAAAQKT